MVVELSAREARGALSLKASGFGEINGSKGPVVDKFGVEIAPAPGCLKMPKLILFL